MLILLCNVCLATERGDMTKEEICKENFNKLFLADPLGKNGTDPEFMAILQKYIFGEIFTIGELDIKTRELLTTAILTATGDKETLKAHIKGNIKVGNNKETIAAVIVQSMPYTGFPNAIMALKTLKETK